MRCKAGTDMPTFIVHLHGVTFSNPDGSSRQDVIAQCRPGQKLVLRAEPENTYDRHAVAVMDSNERQLGYLPSDARDSSCRRAPLRPPPRRLESHRSCSQRRRATYSCMRSASAFPQRARRAQSRLRVSSCQTCSSGSPPSGRGPWCLRPTLLDHCPSTSPG
jgi:hypothetical protein